MRPTLTVLFLASFTLVGFALRAAPPPPPTLPAGPVTFDAETVGGDRKSVV